MIKKLLSALICTVVCACCIIGFVACGSSHTHSYTDTVVQPTCTDKGYTKHTCSCGDEYKDNETDALGHSWGDWTQTKAPTCTEKGEKTRVCSRDSSHVDTIEIDELGHDWGDWTQTKAPSCTEKGEETRVCSRDSSHVEKRAIDTIAHSYTDTVVKPTCTEKGYTKHKCSCGDEYKDNETAALGHDWGDWTQTKAPTCTEKGEETRVCSRDSSHVEKRAIDMIAHDYVDGKCSKCGATDPNYVAPVSEFDAWTDSDDADDFDGDRAVTEADFAIYKAYIAWKASATAKDYDGDTKIDYKDYELSLLGEDVATWLTSADAYDYNKDGVTDKNDYAVYLERKDLVGKYAVSDFDYKIDSTEYTIQLHNSKYDIADLKDDIGGFELEISKDLKLTCKYSDEIKAKLGDDEAEIQKAINSCVIQKWSDILSKATFTLDKLTFAVNLQKAENGFTSSINVKIDGVSMDVTFNLVRAK